MPVRGEHEQDLRKATRIACAMVTDVGFSECVIRGSSRCVSGRAAAWLLALTMSMHALRGLNVKRHAQAACCACRLQKRMQQPHLCQAARATSMAVRCRRLGL